jgi:hypothetical protein
MHKIEMVGYKGWPRCYRLTDGRVELIITGDVGPRVIRFGFVGGDNEFHEVPETLGLAGGDEWRIYGGHRFWHAPEHPSRTYFPDNTPVEAEQGERLLRLTGPTEPTTLLQKQIDITLVEEGVRLTHRLFNRGLWGVEVAPWALSVMAPGGTAILPLPPRRTHEEELLPANALVMWAYTDMADPRWTWGRKYITLRQQADGGPQKLGAGLPDGWLAYARGGHLFVKTYAHLAGAVYPDMGCSAETFTDPHFLELETLGPLAVLPPGEAAEHVEHWFLYDNVTAPTTEAEIDATVLPLAQDAKARAARATG